ncbi:MAG: phospholipase D-like domain-containing protein [Clostridia bacterium]
MNTNKSVEIITAYCKESALEYVENSLQAKCIHKKIMIRFRLDDILNGATDFSIYEYCKKNKWEMFFDLDMHAKVYAFDKDICIIGSANLTNKGIGLSKFPNKEISKLFKLEDNEIQKIDELFYNSVKMTDELYELMKKQLKKEKIEANFSNDSSWNKEILEKCIVNIDTLFQEDFPVNTSPLELVEQEYYDINDNKNIEYIRNYYLNTKLIKWLTNEILSSKNKEIYFGDLSQRIHSCIFIEPKAYRKSVKELQVKMYNWIKELLSDEFIIDVPSKHTERIRLK